MIVERNAYVTFEYVLRDDKGELIEASEVDNPPSYVHGYSQLISGLEKYMEKHKVGDRFKVEVEPQHGYGVRDDSLVVTVPKTEIPEEVNVTVGQTFDAVNEHNHTIKLHVKDVDGDVVTLDANHPLAGIKLNYTITIKAIRPATEDELMNVSAPMMGTDKGQA